MRKDLKEIIICCMGMLLGIVLGGYWAGHKYCLQSVDNWNLAEKHLHMVRLYDIWMKIKESEKSIEEYLIDRKIYSIAIYGMSFMGIRLFYELKNTSVCIKYGIDNNSKMRIPELNIYRLDDINRKEGMVDAIIVSAVFSFNSIKSDLEKLGFTKIIALDEILYDLV